MKKSLLVAMISAGLLGSMMPVYAEEITAAQTETVEEAAAQTEAVETEAQAETTAAAEQAAPVHEALTVLSGVEGVTVYNETDSLVKQVSVRKSFEKEWISEETEVTAFVPEEGSIYDLKIETEDADVLVYLGLSFEEVKEIALYEKEDAVYTVVLNAKDEEVSTEEYALVTTEEAAVYYTTSNLNVREIPSTDGEKLGMFSLASEISVYGKTEGWYLVSYENAYAYVSADYVTDDKAVADAKLEEAKAAEAAAAAAKQAAASQPSYSEPSYSEPSYSEPSYSEPEVQEPTVSEVYEVSRETVPSCDDPDHGTIYITYSDGSVSVETY